jgi:hypothetical protein
MSQVKELAEQVIAAVKSFVTQSMAVLTTRLDGLETALKSIPAPLKGDPGERGADGARGDPGEKGEPGVDGRDADPELITAAVAKAVEALPKPTNGVDGQNGLNAYEIAVSLGFEGTVHDWMKSLDGKPGEPGASVAPEQVLPALRADLQKAIAALPVPKDGVNGKDSTVTVEDFRGLFETESTKALLDFERRAQDVLLKAISTIPAPKDGKDGRDGLGFEDIEVLHDGERTFSLKFARGETTKEFAFKVPALLERGVWKTGQAYEKGDCVSFGGSLWIAQRDTSSRPESDDTWRLAVKRGRDGKDGERGAKGEPGPVGKNGRDLTQLGQDGAKW